MSKFAKDAFGMILSYYQGDFNRTGSAFNSGASSGRLQAPTGLYNGNITAWETNIQPSGQPGYQYEQQTGYTYRYDELNRLVSADFHDYNSGWQNPGNAYDANYSYDADGNITNLQRYDATQIVDNLTYNYPYQNATPEYNDKLEYVQDAAGKIGQDLPNQLAGNYTYDEIGNLVGDVSEN